MTLLDRPLRWFLGRTARELALLFGRARARRGWLPSLGAPFPPAQARHLRWCAYALGALAGLLFVAWDSPRSPGTAPAWAIVVVAALGVSLLLLALGRAAVL